MCAQPVVTSRQDALYFYEPCRKLRGTDMSDLECLAFLQRCGHDVLDEGCLRRPSCDRRNALLRRSRLIPSPSCLFEKAGSNWFQRARMQNALLVDETPPTTLHGDPSVPYEVITTVLFR